MIKVLLFSYKVPYPKKDGGAISIANHIKMLESMPEIELHVFSLDQETDLNGKESLKKNLSPKTKLDIAQINNKIRIIPLICSLFTKNSYLSKRFNSTIIEKQLESILLKFEFDIVILEHLYLCHYLDTIKSISPKTKIILREQNIEHQLWKEVAENEKNLFSKIYLKYESCKLKKFEHFAINAVHGIICLTELNKNYITERTVQTIVDYIPISFACSYEPSKTINTNKIYHVGSMDWKPNLQGLEWYFNSIHHKIVSNLKNLEVHIAGKKMPNDKPWLQANNVINHGEINDIISFEKEFDIMFVPLISGSGVRVKILEGICKGKLIISTKKGAEGINCKTYTNIYIANNAKEFLKALNEIRNGQYLPNLETIKLNFLNEYGIESNKRRTLNLFSHVINH